MCVQYIQTISSKKTVYNFILGLSLTSKNTYAYHMRTYNCESFLVHCVYYDSGPNPCCPLFRLDIYYFSTQQNIVHFVIVLAVTLLRPK